MDFLKTDNINILLRRIMLGQKVNIKYYYFNQILEKEGMIIKIDKKNKLLYLPNFFISFSKIITISTC